MMVGDFSPQQGERNRKSAAFISPDTVADVCCSLTLGRTRITSRDQYFINIAAGASKTRGGAEGEATPPPPPHNTIYLD